MIDDKRDEHEPTKKPEDPGRPLEPHEGEEPPPSTTPKGVPENPGKEPDGG